MFSKYNFWSTWQEKYIQARQKYASEEESLLKKKKVVVIGSGITTYKNFVLHLHNSNKMFFPSMIIKYLTGKLK